MRSSQISQKYNSPVSFWPPIQPTDCPYRPARHQCQCRKLKIERINDKSVSQTPEVKMTHLGCTRATQPPNIPSKQHNRVVGPIRQCDQIKFTPTNVSPTRNSEMAYLRHDQIAQPRGDDPQRSYRVIGPRCQCRQIKIVPTNVSQTPEDEKTYQGPYKPIHLLPRDVGNPLRSTPIGILLYGLQCLKNILQNVSCDDDKSIASSTHLSANTPISV